MNLYQFFPCNFVAWNIWWQVMNFGVHYQCLGYVYWWLWMIEAMSMRELHTVRAMLWKGGTFWGNGGHAYDQRNTAELLLEDGHVVGMEVKDNSLFSGMVLKSCEVISVKVAVHVTCVFDELHWTRKLLGECLGQCQGLVICWKTSWLWIVEDMHESSWGLVGGVS